MNPIIAPSILTADFLELRREIEMINNSMADWFHLDIMDGNFVPNITFGFHIINQIKKVAKKPLDVHLMIVDPDRYIEEFKKAGADRLTVHYEACTHLHRTIEHIRALGMNPQVTINPHTSVSLLKDILEYVDLVLVMTVDPGFGSQTFIQSSYNRIKELKELILQTGSKALIQVDGGVTLANAKTLTDAGVDVLVIGNTVFSAEDPPGVINQLKNLY